MSLIKLENFSLHYGEQVIFENLNFGQRFPFRYDRRHDLNVAATWQVNPRLSFGAVCLPEVLLPSFCFAHFSDSLTVSCSITILAAFCP